MQNEQHRFKRDLTAIVREFRAQNSRKFYQLRQQRKADRSSNDCKNISPPDHVKRRIERLEKQIQSLRTDPELDNHGPYLDSPGFESTIFNEKPLPLRILQDSHPLSSELLSLGGRIEYLALIFQSPALPSTRCRTISVGATPTSLRVRFNLQDNREDIILKLTLNEKQLSFLTNYAQHQKKKNFFFSMLKQIGSTLKKQIKDEIVNHKIIQEYPDLSDTFIMSNYEYNLRMSKKRKNLKEMQNLKDIKVYDKQIYDVNNYEIDEEVVEDYEQRNLSFDADQDRILEMQADLLAELGEDDNFET